MTIDHQQLLHITLVVIGLSVSIFISGGLIVFSAPLYLKYKRVKKDWIICEAQVIGVSIGLYDEYSKGAIPHVYPEIVYKYHYKGRQYQSKQVTFSIHDMKVVRPMFNDLVNRYDPLPVWWNQLTLGDLICIKVNPKAPHEAVVVFAGYLNQQWRYLMLMLIGMLFLSLTLWVVGLVLYL